MISTSSFVLMRPTSLRLTLSSPNDFHALSGSVHTEEFAAFEDEACVPHLGIQLTVKGSSLDVFHHFVDALRNDHGLLRRYNELKLAHHTKSMDDDRAAKNAFIADVLNSEASRGERVD